jgi:excisionase family DNA binding protein
MYEQEDLISLDELCEILKVKRSYIYKLTSKNQIPYYRVGGLKFKLSEVQKWLETRKARVRKTKSFGELIN